MKRVVVLGNGAVGREIANELSMDCQVTVGYHKSIENVEKLKQKNSKIELKQIDVKKKEEIQEFVKDCDMVVSAVPGLLGYETVKTVIECGKNVVDISSFGEDSFTLDELCKKNGVICIPDCGVSPGMSSFFAGYHHRTMDIENYLIYVGGLPFKRVWPWEYVAPFSPVDVLDEYTSSCKIKVNGEFKKVPALSELEKVNFDEIGTFEAFLTDGIQTLWHSIPIKTIKEKTMRYIGYTDKIEILRSMGFFSKKKIDFGNGVKASALDITSKLLFDKWKIEDTTEDFTIMKIIVEGVERNSKEKKRYIYTLFDRYDTVKKQTSMSRVTGFTATTVARLIMNGDFTRVGVTPPEYLGMEDGMNEKILEGLKKYNIYYKQKVEDWKEEELEDEKEDCD